MVPKQHCCLGLSGAHDFVSRRELSVGVYITIQCGVWIARHPWKLARRPFWAEVWFSTGSNSVRIAHTWHCRCFTGQKSKGGGLSLPFGSSSGGGAVTGSGTRLQPGVPIPTWICNTVQVYHFFHELRLPMRCIRGRCNLQLRQFNLGGGPYQSEMPF